MAPRISVLPIAIIGLPLFGQAAPPRDSLSFNPVGKYRLEILSLPPRGQWTGLVVVKAVNGHYAATFTNPDGPGSYPVASVTAGGKTLTITMAGEATGSVFDLTVTGDSLVGTMTSIRNGLTQVRGVRLKE